MPRDVEASTDQPSNKFEFSNRALSKLPGPSGETRSGKPRDRAYYYDTKTQGLEAVVTKGPTITFYAYFWSVTAGKPIRTRLGRYPGLSLEAARKLAHDKVNDILHGYNPAVEKRQNREKLTVGTAMSDYINWLRLNHRKETSIQLFEYFVELINIDLRSKPIDELVPEGVAAFRNRLVEGKIQEERKALLRSAQQPTELSESKKKGHSGPALKKGGYKPNRKTTANRAVRLLSQTYNYLLKTGLWDGINPCTPIKPFPEQPRTRRIKDDELKKFIRACEDLRKKGDTLIPDFLLTCLFSGIRRRNVSSATWNQFDLVAGIWNIPDTKNGLPVKVYLSPYILGILKERQRVASDHWVFAAKSRSGHLEEPLRGLYRVLDKAEIKKDEISIHTLKHTFISCAYECGLNPIVVTRMGGHKIREITARYGHASDRAVKEGYFKVAEHMLAVARNTDNVTELNVASAA